MASFGFSVGDFIALGDLARKIAQALSEARGATAEYKSLCELLLSLNRALYAASAVFFCPDSNTIPGSYPDKASLNGLRYEMECCKRLMGEFLESSKKYTESLLNSRPGKRFKDEWRKITWSLYRTEDVRKLQANLQGHVGAFQLYTFTITCQGLARTERRAIEGAEASHRVELRIVEMFALLKTIQQNLPKTMGYPWEGGWSKDQRPIHFEDALGRVVMLPPMLCRSKDTFHGVLEIIFKDLPGQKKITQKEYEITDGSEGHLIQDSDWESKVLPGLQIAMSVLVRTQSESKAVPHNCPRCDTSNFSATIEKGSIKCRFCQLTFRTFDLDRIVELPESLPIQEGNFYLDQDLSKSQTQSPYRNPTKPTEEQKMPREEDLFRRIHYYRETLNYRKLDFQPRHISLYPLLWGQDEETLGKYPAEGGGHMGAVAELERYLSKVLSHIREEWHKLYDSGSIFEESGLESKLLKRPITTYLMYCDQLWEWFKKNLVEKTSYPNFAATLKEYRAKVSEGQEKLWNDLDLINHDIYDKEVAEYIVSKRVLSNGVSPAAISAASL